METVHRILDMIWSVRGVLIPVFIALVFKYGFRLKEKMRDGLFGGR